MKNILFVIDSKDKKKAKQVESKIKELDKNASIIIVTVDEKQLYYDFIDKTKYTDKEFVCLLNDQMEIYDNFFEIYAEYISEENKTLYLPLIILKGKEKKGVLNNCLWNSNLAITVGLLDHQLALKQMDLTLYSALIPLEDFLNKDYYNSETEFYQHFYFLNSYTYNEENLVVGIPKILSDTSFDLSFEGISDDRKIRNFKSAKEIKKESTLKLV